MPYRAKTQFCFGEARLVAIGEVCADNDAAVLADLDASDGRVPGQLFAKVDEVAEAEPADSDGAP